MSVNGFDRDQADYERNNRLNKPECAPGMDTTFANNSTDIFSTSTVPNNVNAAGQVFTQGVAPAGAGVPNAGALNGQAVMFPGQTPSPNGFTGGMQQQQQLSDDEKFYKAMSAGGKATAGFVKDIVSSCKLLTPMWWYKYFFKVMAGSVGTAGVAMTLKVFGWADGSYAAVGALLSLAFSFLGFSLTNGAAQKCNSLYKSDPSQQPPVPDQSGMGFDSPFPQPDVSAEPLAMDFPDEDDTDIEDTWGGDEEEDDDPFAYNTTVEETAPPPKSIDDALQDLNNMTPGMWTRQYLYQKFTEVLPTLMPDFHVFRDVADGCDRFLQWDSYLSDAAVVSGCKEESIPSIMSIRENYFTIEVVCNRPQGAKMEVIGEEFCKILIHDEQEMNITDKAFIKTETVGGSCTYSIFTAKSAMVSLKDMMLKVQDRIIDPSKTTIPVVIGIDQIGRVVLTDMKKLESVIITGMPRSGKSWLVQSILTQMCAFLAPSELNLYICDPKEGVSDFKRFVLPHVKKFVTDDNGVVETLRVIVKEEGERRRKIIGDAGHVNIWDFKAENPSVQLPLIYVVVDEVVTLSGRMSKETKSEFQGYLRELISQLPALGIRAIIIPHILNNDVIEKKTSDLVLFRASVKGDADHVEKATGAKPRNFPYKLVNTGDMAIRLADGDSSHPDVMFIHGACLTTSNRENNKLFDYLRQVWARLDKEETGVLAEEARRQKDTQEAIASVDDEEVDLFGDDDWS